MQKHLAKCGRTGLSHHLQREALWAVTIVGDKFILDFSRKILDITQNNQLTQSVLHSNKPTLNVKQVPD